MSAHATVETGWFSVAYKLVLAAGDVGDIHVVGRGGEILVLLAGEDVEGNEMDLGVTVLARLGGGHVDDLAGTALDHNEAVLAQGRALHGVGERRAGIGGVELELMLREGNVQLAASFGHEEKDGG